MQETCPVQPSGPVDPALYNAGGMYLRSWVIFPTAVPSRLPTYRLPQDRMQRPSAVDVRARCS